MWPQLNQYCPGIHHATALVKARRLAMHAQFNTVSDLPQLEYSPMTGVCLSRLQNTNEVEEYLLRATYRDLRGNQLSELETYESNEWHDLLRVLAIVGVQYPKFTGMFRWKREFMNLALSFRLSVLPIEVTFGVASRGKVSESMRQCFSI